MWSKKKEDKEIVHQININNKNKNKNCTNIINTNEGETMILLNFEFIL